MNQKISSKLNGVDWFSILLFSFADGTRKIVYPSGEEETHFNDGTVQRVGNDKMKVIDYANGLKVMKMMNC